MSTTKDILLMLAKDGGVHKFDNCEIHVTVVESAKEVEQNKPDYSHLVGKWAKWPNDPDGAYIVENITSDRFFVKTKIKRELISYPIEALEILGGVVQIFDHNPDFIPVPSEVKFVWSPEGNLCLVYGNGKTFYGSQGEYFVATNFCNPTPCHLEPCKLEDVKVGEFVYYAQNLNHLDKISRYCLKTNNGLYFVSSNGGVMCIFIECPLCYRVVAD